jgi:predicted DNA-binding transcriptional regulator AlpA
VRLAADDWRLLKERSTAPGWLQRPVFAPGPLAPAGAHSYRNASTGLAPQKAVHKEWGCRAPTTVRLGVAVPERSAQRTDHAPRGLDGPLGDAFDSQSARRPTAAIDGVLEKGTTQRRRTFDEALDALQLLTVTDVCKLLRISKPTLWRLRRSGNFPDPTTVTERIFGWRRAEIDAWLASRPNSRRY